MILPGLDRFHLCALYAARIAVSEGRLGESEYVRQMTYRMCEGGAFRDENPETTEEAR